MKEPKPEHNGPRVLSPAQWLEAHPELAKIADSQLAAESTEPIPVPSATTQWPSPEPLKCGLAPVIRLTPDMLPPVLRPWIEDICERAQCPPDFVAAPAIVAAGSLIGRKAAIYPKQHDSWHEFPNLWGCIVGRPGVMKSPALAEGLAPLRKAEAEAKEANVGLSRQHKADALRTKLEREAAMVRARKQVAKGECFDARELLPDDDKDGPPPAKRYVVNNATLEALGEILMGNSSLLLYQDELTGLLAAMIKPGNEELRPFLLQAWSGKESYTFDRIGRGLNRYVPPFVLAMLGGIQPHKLARHLKDAAQGGEGDDGFIQRFSLLVWPDMSKKWKNVDRCPDSAARECAFAAMDALNAIEATEKPREVRFTSEAGERFLEWRTELEDRLRGGSETPAMESHLAKYRKLVPALALIFALLKDADAQVVEAEELAVALKWCQYLESHIRRAFESIESMANEAASRLLAKLIAGEAKPITARTIYRKGWTGLATPADVEAALQLLESHHWLAALPAPKNPAGGRPTEEYQMHPEAAKYHQMFRR